MTKLDELVSRLDKMHTAVFGIDGQGGLHRWVQDHEKRIAELQSHKNKSLGVMMVVTAAFSFIGAKVVSLISSK